MIRDQHRTAQIQELQNMVQQEAAANTKHFLGVSDDHGTLESPKKNEEHLQNNRKSTQWDWYR